MEEKNNIMEKNKISFETKIIGLTGSILIIIAYSLNSLQYLSSANIIYPTLNIIGASLLIWKIWKNKNWSDLFIEFFWFFIALISLLKIFHVINI